MHFANNQDKLVKKKIINSFKLNIEKSNFYLKDITSKIPFKTKVLLLTPSVVLQKLLKTKHLLKKYGIDFSVYH